MAVQAKFKIPESADRFSVVFSELTGAYDSSTNIGGWGSPNPDTTDATTVNIYIKTLDGVTHTISNPVGFPTTDKTKELVIPYTDFGGGSGDVIPDGIYPVRYECRDSGNVALTTDMQYVAWVGGLQCCLTKLRKKLPIPTSSCKCDLKEITEISNAQILLDSICDQLKCDDLDGAQNIIDYLKNFCKCHCTECQ